MPFAANQGAAARASARDALDNLFDDVGSIPHRQ